MEVIEVVESAKAVLNQWLYAQDKSFDNFLGFMTSADGDEHWTLPNENMIKVNTDAAIFEPTNSYSYTFVIRNHHGELFEARSKGSRGNIAPEITEFIGIRETLSWIKEQGRTGVIVKTDCLVAVQAIRSSSSMLSYFGRVITECKTLLAELQNRVVSLKFVKRSANKVAHYLARYNCSNADCVWRMSNAHPEFIDVLMNDLMNE